MKNHYSGKTSDQTKLAVLRWAQRWLKCDFDMHNVSLARTSDFLDCRHVAKAALPYTPYMLAKLEAFCADTSKPLHQLGGEYIEDMVTKDKNPNQQKMRMKPFFGLVRDLTNKKWFDLWLSTIRTSDSEDYHCVFPDYKLENDGSLI